MWAIGSVSAGDDSVFHYTGKSAAGRWSRTELAHAGEVFGIARIPRQALWAAGTVNTKTGANATIWADGRV